MNTSAQGQARVNLHRATVSSLFGSIIEWYDFFLYGVVAGLVFDKLYFPGDNEFISTMLAYGTFALGFVARPLGGIIFGHFGDTVGRKKMLMLTLLLMGGATVAIGFIPTYAQIGIWAPILLLFFRIIQGIGLGGEWGGAVLMTYESAPPARRGFFSSIPQTGMSLGLVLASGVVGLLSWQLSNEDFLSWGWRVAFLLSGLMALVGGYIRNHVSESPEFEAMKHKAKTEKRIEKPVLPLVDTLRRYPRIILACMGARMIDGVFFNVFGVYSLNYLTRELDLPRTQALMGVMISAVLMTCFIPFWGAVADRVGKARVYGLGALFAALSAFPAFYVMQTFSHNVYLVWLAIIIPFGIFHAAVFGTMSSFFSSCFDAKVRYTAISFVYQLAGVLAGGLTPIVATVLTDINGGDPWLLCLYVLAAGLLSVACTRWIARHVPDHATSAGREMTGAAQTSIS
ncbi:MFS transporter [Advenella sp. S44]|uniref:MFS transporter n=1 Tax=Advenella sp. S44 TaxID=1982755 RepID=UPI000C2A572D|nr:MFS transporter [Advenella sp. S44]PJX22466.1 MFS transporter [Advenella sp. S44]